MTTTATNPGPVFAHPLQIVRPSFPPLERFQDEFAEALATGQVTNNSKWVLAFEERLTEFVGVPTLAFSSGQAALLAMMRAAGIVSGEVITPSFTFAATPHAIVWSGARPVFAEVRSDMSFGLDPDDVERRITGETTAILAVCPYGIPCDYGALEAIAERHGIRLLVDSAAAFGARVGGKPVGGRGDAQIFSFHATKAFATMEGGALCSRDPAIISAAKAIRNFGLEGADAVCPGFNGKMLEICALIGLQQLETFDAHAARRRDCARRISEGLAAMNGLAVGRAPSGVDPIWLYLPVTIDAKRFGLHRDDVADLLARENLMVRKYYSPACHQMTAYADYPANGLQETERFAAEVLALPIYNDMTTEECDGIVECFARVAAQGRAK